MAKKSFKEKEQAYLAANKIEQASTYVPKKRAQDEAYDLLKEKGFNVSIKDFILHCECKDTEEYERYESLLLKHFGKDGRVAFSFGATIKKMTKELRNPFSVEEEAELEK